MSTEVIGQKLRELRGNLPAETVSKAIGVSKSTLSMYEKGKRVPRDCIKVKIAKFYGKSIEFIFFN